MVKKQQSTKSSVSFRAGSKCNLCCLLLLALMVSFATFIQINAQFFTKSNSKSIPRMGRRSDIAPLSNFEQRAELRRALLESLLARLATNGLLEGPEDQAFDFESNELNADGQDSLQTTNGHSDGLFARLWSPNKAALTSGFQAKRQQQQQQRHLSHQALD